MSKRKQVRAVSRPETLAAIARSLKLGRSGRFFDDDDVVELLRAAVAQTGGQEQFAELTGTDRTYVNSVVRKRRRAGSGIIRALALRKVYVLQRS